MKHGFHGTHHIAHLPGPLQGLWDGWLVLACPVPVQGRAHVRGNLLAPAQLSVGQTEAVDYRAEHAGMVETIVQNGLVLRPGGDNDSGHAHTQTVEVESRASRLAGGDDDAVR